MEISARVQQPSLDQKLDHLAGINLNQHRKLAILLALAVTTLTGGVGVVGTGFDAGSARDFQRLARGRQGRALKDGGPSNPLACLPPRSPKLPSRSPHAQRIVHGSPTLPPKPPFRYRNLARHEPTHSKRN